MPLHLIVLQPPFAVCRFQQQSSFTKVLSWIQQQELIVTATTGISHHDEEDKNKKKKDTSSSSSSSDRSNLFLSVTQTADELSIVCHQDLLLRRPITATENELELFGMMKMERDWSCFKVQGPLEFGLTGILASLANPLAQAQIPIFAVSTYDTDYLLVKFDKLQQAIAVLTAEGHLVQAAAALNEKEKEQENRDAVNRIKNPPPPPTLATVDDPAFDKFEPDPIVSRLLERSHIDLKQQQQHSEETFGLVAVVGWPPNRNQILESYQRFRTAVELCFDEADVVSAAMNCLEKDCFMSPAVYLYPFHALHVTVASPYDLRRPVPKSEQAKMNLTEQWRCVIERATQRDAWPKNPLQLEILSAQIGSKAGILLWKETTGGLQAMRDCIKSTTSEMKEELQHYGVSTDTLSIPSIVHTTMLRFHREPRTSVKTVQERFKQQVLPRLHEFFPARWQLDTFTLVCEQIPYMHIPADDKHIVCHCSLNK